MTPSDLLEPPSPAPVPRRLRPAAQAMLLGSLLVGLAALLAFAFALLFAGTGAGRFAAPLSAALASLAALLPGTLLALRVVRELEASRAQLVRQGGLDMSDGLLGRTQFIAQAEREWARARRYGGGAALLLVEIDRHQRLAQARGEDAVAAVLRELARTIGPTLRVADALGRFGTGQLVVWLAEADPTGALDVADRIREGAESLDIDWQHKLLRATVSVGVAGLRPAHQNLTALVADAEAAAQAARQAGGNCVRAAPVDPLRLQRIGPSVGDNQAAGPSV